MYSLESKTWLKQRIKDSGEAVACYGEPVFKHGREIIDKLVGKFRAGKAFYVVIDFRCACGRF